MSRVGKKPIAIPQGVKVSLSAGGVQVQGPKGELVTPIPPGISFSVESGQLLCQRSNDERQQRAFHGLARALAQNAMTGVTQGFSKELDIVGVGYKALLDGSKPDPYKQKGIRYVGELLKKKAGKAAATGAAK
jgi:large subunit ribosomal protein L6